MSKKYSIFQNICKRHLQNSLFLSSGELLRILKIDATPLEQASGDGGVYANLIHEKEFIFSNARNMALACEQKSAILCIEDISYHNLKLAKKMLDSNPKLKTEISSKLLELGLHFSDDVEIFHIVEILHDVIGVEYIKSNLVHRFDDFRGAIFFGGFSKYKNIKEKSVNLLESTGLKIIKNKKRFSSSYFEQLQISKEFALKAAGTNLLELVDSGADFITSLDSSAFVMFDQYQKEIEKHVGREDIDMPFLHISQILSLSLGAKNRELLGLNLHKIETGII